MPHYVCPLYVSLSVRSVPILLPLPRLVAHTEGTDNQSDSLVYCTYRGYWQAARVVVGAQTTSQVDGTQWGSKLYIQRSRQPFRKGAHSEAHWRSQLYIQRAQTTSQIGGTNKIYSVKICLI